MLRRRRVCLDASCPGRISTVEIPTGTLTRIRDLRDLVVISRSALAQLRDLLDQIVDLDPDGRLVDSPEPQAGDAPATPQDSEEGDPSDPETCEAQAQAQPGRRDPPSPG